MYMETYVRKDFYGKWKAETEVPLGGRKLLCFHTSKDSRGKLSTMVSVHTLADDGKSRVHAMFSDYSKHVKIADVKRVTRTEVTKQHMKVLDKFEDIKADVAAFYAAKEPACSP